MKDCFASPSADPPAIRGPEPGVVNVMGALCSLKGDGAVGDFKLSVTVIVDRRLEVTCCVISVDNIDDKVSRHMANRACAERWFKRFEDFRAAVHLHIHSN